jgi:hypothetical protein
MIADFIVRFLPTYTTNRLIDVTRARSVSWTRGIWITLKRSSSLTNYWGKLTTINVSQLATHSLPSILKIFTEKQALAQKIAQWTSPNAKGKLNAEFGRKFSIKLVFPITLPWSSLDWSYVLLRLLAVFDTVGALGLPKEILIRNPNMQLFGFNDLDLGTHVETALQALALNERRADFVRAALIWRRKVCLWLIGWNRSLALGIRPRKGRRKDRHFYRWVFQWPDASEADRDIQCWFSGK